MCTQSHPSNRKEGLPVYLRVRCWMGRRLPPPLRFLEPPTVMNSLILECLADKRVLVFDFKFRVLIRRLAAAIWKLCSFCFLLRSRLRAELGGGLCDVLYVLLDPIRFSEVPDRAYLSSHFISRLYYLISGVWWPCGHCISSLPVFVRRVISIMIF